MATGIAVRRSVLCCAVPEPIPANSTMDGRTSRRLLTCHRIELCTYRSHLLFLPRQWRQARDTRFIGLAEFVSAIIQLHEHFSSRSSLRDRSNLERQREQMIMMMIDNTVLGRLRVTGGRLNNNTNVNSTMVFCFFYPSFPRPFCIHTVLTYPSPIIGPMAPKNALNDVCILAGLAAVDVSPAPQVI